ncbi:MAG: helix-turn-helix domain-containing protein [Candidatus Adiutrix sp.]
MDIEAQKLRQDLFYRLGAILIHIPPLRERIDDVPLLGDHFIKKHQLHLKSRTQGLSLESIAWLQRKPWLGNVRELEHTISSAMLFAKHERFLKIENFNVSEQFLSPLGALSDTGDESPNPTYIEPVFEDEFISHGEVKMHHEEMEKERIIKILEKTKNHKAAAAAILGISPQLLNSKLKKYNLQQIFKKKL